MHGAVHNGNGQRRAEQCRPDMGIAIAVAPAPVMLIGYVPGGKPLNGFFEVATAPCSYSMVVNAAVEPGMKRCMNPCAGPAFARHWSTSSLMSTMSVAPVVATDMVKFVIAMNYIF